MSVKKSIGTHSQLGSLKTQTQQCLPGRSSLYWFVLGDLTFTLFLGPHVPHLILSLQDLSSLLLVIPPQDLSPMRAISCSYTVHAMAAIMVLLRERGTPPRKNP